MTTLLTVGDVIRVYDSMLIDAGLPDVIVDAPDGNGQIFMPHQPIYPRGEFSEYAGVYVVVLVVDVPSVKFTGQAPFLRHANDGGSRVYCQKTDGNKQIINFYQTGVENDTLHIDTPVIGKAIFQWSSIIYN